MDDHNHTLMLLCVCNSCIGIRTKVVNTYMHASLANQTVIIYVPVDLLHSGVKDPSFASSTVCV